MDSIYKKGDKVLVKSVYDQGCRQWDYTCTFMPDMLEHFGGKIVTIDTVNPLSRSSDAKLNRESIKYQIKEDRHMYNWSAEMFTCNHSELTLIDLFTE